MAKLTEQELAEIRKQHNIKPEHLGKQRSRPSGKSAPDTPEWLTRAIG